MIAAESSPLVAVTVPGAGQTMRQRFYRVTAELLDADPRMAVVLADIGVDGMRATGARERHPRRVINVGIREALMASVAGGMALEGMRPIIHSYAPFLVERSFEQLKLDLGHQAVGAIVVSVGASYDWAEGGRTHHAPGDVALISTLPGWTIHVPGHADEVEHILRSAAGTDDRVYIRLSDQHNRHARLAGCNGMDVVREGKRGAATVVAVGPILDAVVRAAAGMELTILYSATPRPFGGDTLRRHVTGNDLIVVEPYLAGTSAAEVTAALADRPIRLLGIGVPNAEHRRYGTRRDHDRAYGLDHVGLRARLAAFLERRQIATG